MLSHTGTRKNHEESGYPLLLKAKYLDLLGWVAGAGRGGGGVGMALGNLSQPKPW